MRPLEIKEDGFKHLDRAVELCARHEIYTIIDLHALPGFQNQHWHSDNPTHKALFWKHKHFQDRIVNIWEAIAERYKDNPWVAGYNPINEPADPTEKAIMPVYRRLYEAIRAVDPNHIIFLEGHRYSQDFNMFGDPWENVVYTNHDYALPGFADGGPYPGVSRGKYVDKEVLEQTFLMRSSYILEHDVPIWVGEFGPIYKGEEEADAMRYQLLRDQLEIYTRYGANWAIWTYKDIGLQGVVYAAQFFPESVEVCLSLRREPDRGDGVLVLGRCSELLRAQGVDLPEDLVRSSLTLSVGTAIHVAPPQRRIGPHEQLEALQ